MRITVSELLIRNEERFKLGTLNLGSWFKGEGDFGKPPTSKRKIDMDSLVWAACEGNSLHDFAALPIISYYDSGYWSGRFSKTLCSFSDIFYTCLLWYVGISQPRHIFVQGGPPPRTKEWETIVIDEFIPCNVRHGKPQPAFAKPLGEEIWVPLLLGVSQLYPKPRSILKEQLSIYLMLSLT